jgi:hypothetical protein
MDLEKLCCLLLSLCTGKFFTNLLIWDLTGTLSKSRVVKLGRRQWRWTGLVWHSIRPDGPEYSAPDPGTVMHRIHPRFHSRGIYVYVCRDAPWRTDIPDRQVRQTGRQDR